MHSDSSRIIFYVAVSQALPCCIQSLPGQRFAAHMGNVWDWSWLHRPTEEMSCGTSCSPSIPTTSCTPTAKWPRVCIFNCRGELKQHSSVFCLLCNLNSCMEEGSGLWISGGQIHRQNSWSLCWDQGVLAVPPSVCPGVERLCGCCVAQEKTKHSLVCRNITKIPN